MARSDNKEEDRILRDILSTKKRIEIPEHLIQIRTQKIGTGVRIIII